MKSLVIFDMKSATGTEIAEAIKQGIDKCSAILADPTDVNPEELSQLSLLIIGSPIIKEKASDRVLQFVDSIPANALNNVSVAAFDTRSDADNPKKSFFSFLSEGEGNGAKQIADKLRKKGGLPVIAPERFFVEANKNIKAEEITRAKNWGSLACHA